MKYKNWIYAAVLIVIGLFITINPLGSINALVVLLGIFTVAFGIYSLVKNMKLFDNEDYKKSVLIKGTANIVIGIVAVIFPAFVGGTAWKAMIYILAVYMLLYGVGGFVISYKLKNEGIQTKWTESFVSLLIAIILFIISPERLGIFIIRIIGIAAMIVGLIFVFLEVKITKSVTKVDVEVRDADDSEVIENKTENSEN